MQETYSWQKLRSRRNTRVLLLSAGKDDEDLHCQIEEICVDNPPDYEAISYTWGDDRATILKLHCLNQGIIPIAGSLHDALRRFRQHHATRRLWVDAISIDQTDKEEKGAQVLLMHDIFKAAFRVLVWLGPESDNSSLVYDYLEGLEDTTVDEDIEELTRFFRRDAMWDEYSDFWPDLTIAFPSNSIQQIALLKFILRPWFRRIWCQQEAAVNENVQVFCGLREASWDQLSAMHWQMRRPSLIGYQSLSLELPEVLAQGTDLARALRMIFNINLLRLRRSGTVRNHGPVEMLMLLNSAGRQCGATDARDRVFALQHLEYQQQNEVSIFPHLPDPSYIDTVAQCYTNVAKTFLDRGFTSIFASAGTLFRRVQDLPSWAPDLTYANSPTELVFDNRGHFEDASQRTVGNCRLGKIGHRDVAVVGGFVFDRVKFVSGYVPLVGSTWVQELEYFEEVHNLELEVTAQVSTCSTYPTGESVVKAFWQTLTGNFAYSDPRGPPQDFHELHNWQRSRHMLDRSNYAMLRDEKTPEEESNQAYRNAMRLRGIFVATQFCITEQGYFGIVPGDVRSGDVVVLAWGCKMPLILTRTKNYFVLRGPCAINGIMKGEALFTKHGQALLEDAANHDLQPAIFKSLPPQWRKVSAVENLRLYRSKAYGSQRLFLRDPRTWLKKSLFARPGRDWISRREDVNNEEFWVNTRYIISKGLPEGWKQFASDYGPYYVNDDSREAGFDHPVIRMDLQLTTLLSEWEVVPPVRPLTYFKDDEAGIISFRDPRLLSASSGPLPGDWCFEYDFQIQETFFSSRSCKASSPEDPRFVNPRIGPLPDKWSAERKSNGAIIFKDLEKNQETEVDPCLDLDHPPEFPGFVIV